MLFFREESVFLCPLSFYQFFTLTLIRGWYCRTSEAEVTAGLSLIQLLK
jgi:hypothetical protein